jgi:hypothetical protein
MMQICRSKPLLQSLCSTHSYKSRCHQSLLLITNPTTLLDGSSSHSSHSSHCHRGYHQTVTTDRTNRTNRAEQKKEAELLSFLDRHSNDSSHDDDKNQDIEKVVSTEATKTTTEKTATIGGDTEVTTTKAAAAAVSTNIIEKEQLEKERKELFNEARDMTLSLYRTCVRCTKYIRYGNENDELEFKVREDEQKANRLDMKNFKTLSFEPPVERDNELKSRSLYYLAFIKESFGQEVDCLTKNIPWREDDVVRFSYLMEQGEKRRAWILEDYKFDDPYGHLWNDNNGDGGIKLKLDLWEKRATNLIQSTYQMNGWQMKSDFNPEDSNINSSVDFENAMDDDDDWDA